MTALRSHLAHAMALSGHKISKREAKYGEGMPQRHCGICLYFEPDFEPGGTCRIVAGRIDADDWCKFWQLKTGSAAPAA